ncbi:hypothetical protein BGX28_008983 [Mortierella sp. GBA30]|nr:hypothetical protein BGX28_008983 [Mortierella sp. GBA30]
MARTATSEASASSSSRRSNRTTAKPTATKAEEPANKNASNTTKTTSASTPTESSNGATIVKRKVGRPLGSTKKKTVTDTVVDTTKKVPGRRGRKPKAATTGLQTIDNQVSGLEVKPTATTKTESASKPGRKRKLDVEDLATEDSKSAVKKTRTDDDEKTDEKKPSTTGKRGRPAGSGKKQKQAAAAAAAAASAKDAASAKGKDESEGEFNGIKLTIERCTTCTQYHKNVTRIFKLAKELYPHALVHEEVVPNSKSFEIYLSVNGSKNKLIWSGKAHAPPKRLAFPDSDVFVDLLKAEFTDK